MITVSDMGLLPERRMETYLNSEIVLPSTPTRRYLDQKITVLGYKYQQSYVQCLITSLLKLVPEFSNTSLSSQIFGPASKLPESPRDYIGKSQTQMDV